MQKDLLLGLISIRKNFAIETNTKMRREIVAIARWCSICLENTGVGYSNTVN
jgi:hypothetical protein